MPNLPSPLASSVAIFPFAAAAAAATAAFNNAPNCPAPGPLQAISHVNTHAYQHHGQSMPHQAVVSADPIPLSTLPFTPLCPVSSSSTHNSFMNSCSDFAPGRPDCALGPLSFHSLLGYLINPVTELSINPPVGYRVGAAANPSNSSGGVITACLGYNQTLSVPSPVSNANVQSTGNNTTANSITAAMTGSANLCTAFSSIFNKAGNTSVTNQATANPAVAAAAAAAIAAANLANTILVSSHGSFPLHLGRELTVGHAASESTNSNFASQAITSISSLSSAFTPVASLTLPLSTAKSTTTSISLNNALIPTVNTISNTGRISSVPTPNTSSNGSHLEIVGLEHGASEVEAHQVRGSGFYVQQCSDNQASGYQHLVHAPLHQHLNPHQAVNFVSNLFPVSFGSHQLNPFGAQPTVAPTHHHQRQHYRHQHHYYGQNSLQQQNHYQGQSISAGNETILDLTFEAPIYSNQQQNQVHLSSVNHINHQHYTHLNLVHNTNPYHQLHYNHNSCYRTPQQHLHQIYGQSYHGNPPVSFHSKPLLSKQSPFSPLRIYAGVVADAAGAAPQPDTYVSTATHCNVGRGNFNTTGAQPTVKPKYYNRGISCHDEASDSVQVSSMLVSVGSLENTQLCSTNHNDEAYYSAETSSIENPQPVMIVCQDTAHSGTVDRPALRNSARSVKKRVTPASSNCCREISPIRVANSEGIDMDQENSPNFPITGTQLAMVTVCSAVDSLHLADVEPSHKMEHTTLNPYGASPNRLLFDVPHSLAFPASLSGDYYSSRNQTAMPNNVASYPILPTSYSSSRCQTVTCNKDSPNPHIEHDSDAGLQATGPTDVGVQFERQATIWKRDPVALAIKPRDVSGIDNKSRAKKRRGHKAGNSCSAQAPHTKNRATSVAAPDICEVSVEIDGIFDDGKVAKTHSKYDELKEQSDKSLSAADGALEHQGSLIRVTSTTHSIDSNSTFLDKSTLLPDSIHSPESDSAGSNAENLTQSAFNSIDTGVVSNTGTGLSATTLSELDTWSLSRDLDAKPCISTEYEADKASVSSRENQPLPGNKEFTGGN